MDNHIHEIMNTSTIAQVKDLDGVWDYILDLHTGLYDAGQAVRNEAAFTKELLSGYCPFSVQVCATATWRGGERGHESSVHDGAGGLSAYERPMHA